MVIPIYFLTCSNQRLLLFPPHLLSSTFSFSFPLSFSLLSNQVSQTLLSVLYMFLSIWYFLTLCGTYFHKITKLLLQTAHVNGTMSTQIYLFRPHFSHLPPTHTCRLNHESRLLQTLAAEVDLMMLPIYAWNV